MKEEDKRKTQSGVDSLRNTKAQNICNPILRMKRKEINLISGDYKAIKNVVV